MADVAGLVLSIGAIVHILYLYGKDVKEAQREIVSLNSELLALSSILEDISQNEEFLIKSAHFLDTLSLGNETIEEILAKLEKPKGKAAQFRKRLQWPFTKKEIEQLQRSLQHVKETLMLSMMSDASTVTYDIRRELRDFRDEYQTDQLQQEQIARNKSLEELRHWLEGDVDQKQKHQRILKARQPKTGQWFLDSDGFTQWLTDEAPDTPRVLVLIGKSGAGKSSLMSLAVHAAQTKYEKHAGRHKRALAYCYVSFNEDISQEPMNVFCSLLSHLSYAHPEVINGMTPKRGQMESLSLEEIESRMMLAASKATSTVHLFVDAINECRYPDPVLESLLKVTEATPNIRLLVTTTTEDKALLYRARARPPSARFVKMEPVDEDIKIYIAAKLEAYRNLRRLDPELKQQIMDQLGKYSQGMFRYTQLQLDLLGGQPNGKLVQRALNVLHKDINESYAVILDRIPDSDKSIAKEALTWLCFEYKPMSLEKIVEALAFESGERSLDEWGRLTDPDSLFRWFQGMVSRGHSGASTMTLSHSSVRTFLLSEEIKESKAAFFSLNQRDADALMMRKCLTYVMFNDFSQGYLDRFPWRALQERWPLLRYAATQWAIHAYQLGDHIRPEDEQLVVAFLNTWHKPRHGNFGFWVQCINGTYADVEVAKKTQPLYYAASYGLRKIVRSWLAQQKGLDLDAPGGRFMSNAIRIACFRGHYSIAKDLRDAGARLPSKSKTGQKLWLSHRATAAGVTSSDDKNASATEKLTITKETYQPCCTQIIERYLACGECIYNEHDVIHLSEEAHHCVVEEMTLYVGGPCPNHPNASRVTKVSGRR